MNALCVFAIYWIIWINEKGAGTTVDTCKAELSRQRWQWFQREEKGQRNCVWNSLGKGRKCISLARGHENTQDPSNPGEEVSSDSEWPVALDFTCFAETYLKRLHYLQTSSLSPIIWPKQIMMTWGQNESKNVHQSIADNDRKLWRLSNHRGMVKRWLSHMMD